MGYDYWHNCVSLCDQCKRCWASCKASVSLSASPSPRAPPPPLCVQYAAFGGGQTCSMCFLRSFLTHFMFLSPESLGSRALFTASEQWPSLFPPKMYCGAIHPISHQTQPLQTNSVEGSSGCQASETLRCLFIEMTIKTNDLLILKHLMMPF